MSDNALTRWRMRRVMLIMTAGVVISFIAVIDNRGWLLVRSVDDLRVYDQVQVSLVQVLQQSGGLLEVDVADDLHRSAATRVRVWGIALPPDPDAALSGITLIDELCAAGAIGLELEPRRTRDGQGNLLAHVRLNDGQLLGAVLLAQGRAICDERWPHERLIEYAQREQEARLRGIGCWRSPTVDQ